MLSRTKIIIGNILVALSIFSDIFRGLFIFFEWLWMGIGGLAIIILSIACVLGGFRDNFWNLVVVAVIVIGPIILANSLKQLGYTLIKSGYKDLAEREAQILNGYSEDRTLTSQAYNRYLQKYYQACKNHKLAAQEHEERYK